MGDVQACRRDMVRGGSLVREPGFKLTTANSMSAEVRKILRDMDPRAEKCEGDGKEACLWNAAMEIECKHGVCSNREVQRRNFVTTEAFWS